MKNMFRVKYLVTNKLHADRRFQNVPSEIFAGGLRGVKKGDILHGIAHLKGDDLFVIWEMGAISTMPLDLVKDAFELEEVLDVNKEELNNIMDDSYRQVGWKDTSYRLCEFVGIDPTDVP